jgi:hypothetical protein
MHMSELTYSSILVLGPVWMRVVTNTLQPLYPSKKEPLLLIA